MRKLLLTIFACCSWCTVTCAATYQLTTGSAVIRTADGAFIPADPANRDYAAFLAWQTKGNTPDPAPIVAVTTQQAAPPSVPKLIQLLQAKGVITAQDAATLTGP